ncbi:MAG TPA: hypothetical protein VE956_00125 [Nodularia sp. (in: cyanobacteria)]|nr:hypothetical protein [Nodularia sp. (in: cyanobacteria)]
MEVTGQIQKLQYDDTFNGVKILVTEYYLEDKDGKKYKLDIYDCKPEYLGKTLIGWVSALGYGRDLDQFSGYIQKRCLRRAAPTLCICL